MYVEDSQFSPHMVLVVLRILDVGGVDFYVVSVVLSVSSHGSFYGF
jgi:hypothetical protein